MGIFWSNEINVDLVIEDTHLFEYKIRIIKLFQFYYLCYLKRWILIEDTEIHTINVKNQKIVVKNINASVGLEDAEVQPVQWDLPAQTRV
jgi:hypothetical protein